MIKKLIVILIGVCCCMSAMAQQTRDEIQRRQRQLQQELNDLNNTLNQIKKTRKQSVGELVLIQRKIRTRQELVDNINHEITAINTDIAQNIKTINQSKKQLDTLKLNYAHSLAFAYKNRNSYDNLNFIFSAQSFNDAIKRITYLKSYRRYRENQVADIRSLQAKLQKQINTLNGNKVNKNTALTNQNTQLVALETDKKDKDQSILQLKSQEGELAVEINKKNKQRLEFKNALRKIINQEIAEENARQAKIAKQKADAIRQQEAARRKAAQDEENARQRQLAEERAAAALAKQNTQKPAAEKEAEPKREVAVVKPHQPEPKIEVQNTRPQSQPRTSTRSYSVLETNREDLVQSLDFEKNKGGLPWPAEGYISTPYGNHTVPGTSLQDYNPGIDIALPVGGAVHSVASGDVTRVIDLDGSVMVTIRHGKYFTAYSNLSRANVSRGQKVNAGTVIGAAGASSDGQGGSITFMITDDNGTNLNPERWLRHR